MQFKKRKKEKVMLRWLSTMRLIMKMMKKLRRKHHMEKQLRKVNPKKMKSMTSLTKLKSSSTRIFLRCQNKRSQHMLLKEEIQNNHMKRPSNLHLLLLLQRSAIITTRRSNRQSLRRKRRQLTQFQKLLTKNSLTRLCKRQ